MNVFSALLFLYFHEPCSLAPQELWYSSKTIVRFVDTIDLPGIAYQESRDTVTLLSPEAQVVKKIKFPRDSIPLWYSNAQGLVFRPATPFESNSDTGPTKSVFDPILQIFAQGSNVFVRSTGITYVGSTSCFTFPHYDRLSGIGISPGKDLIALLTLPMSAPLLQIARRRDSDWSLDTFIRSPEIQGVGPCSILPRFNDLLFLNQDVVIFIGVFIGEVRTDRLNAFENRLMDLSAHGLDQDRAQREPCYLFAMRVSDGLTEGVARFSFTPGAERGGPRIGILSKSYDRSVVYIKTSDGILQLSAKEVLDRSGLVPR